MDRKVVPCLATRQRMNTRKPNDWITVNGCAITSRFRINPLMMLPIKSANHLGLDACRLVRYAWNRVEHGFARSTIQMMIYSSWPPAQNVLALQKPFRVPWLLGAVRACWKLALPARPFFVFPLHYKYIMTGLEIKENHCILTVYRDLALL